MKKFGDFINEANGEFIKEGMRGRLLKDMVTPDTKYINMRNFGDSVENGYLTQSFVDGAGWAESRKQFGEEGWGSNLAPTDSINEVYHLVLNTDDQMQVFIVMDGRKVEAVIGIQYLQDGFEMWEYMNLLIVGGASETILYALDGSGEHTKIYNADIG